MRTVVSKIQWPVLRDRGLIDRSGVKQPHGWRVLVEDGAILGTARVVCTLDYLPVRDRLHVSGKCKVDRNEEVFCPVKKPSWKAVVFGDKVPIQVSRWGGC